MQILVKEEDGHCGYLMHGVGGKIKRQLMHEQ
jgi:hypothetical protein